MSGEPLDLLTFDDPPSWLNPPPPVSDTPSPWLDQPQPLLDEPAQAKARQDAQSSSSSNHPGFEKPSNTDDRLPVTADFETSQRNFSPEDTMEINNFFQNIREEEYERINKKRRMRASQNGESSFGNGNNQLDEPQASQPMGRAHGKKKWNHYSSSERLPHDPPTAGLSKGVANSQSRSATALPPIIELKELSIDKAPPKMQSSPVVEYPKASDNASPTSTTSLKAGIVSSADTFSSPTRPLTEEDFLASKRKFEPSYEANIESFFHDIYVGEARKMGRPGPIIRSFHWGSERRGQDWTPFENGEFNTVPDEWGQPDEVQGGNSGGSGGNTDDAQGISPVGWGGQSDEAQGINSGDSGSNKLNPGTSPPVNTQADFSWKTSADAGQSQQAVTNEHADFPWNDTADAGPSEIATKQQSVWFPEKGTPDAGPSKNSRIQEDAAINRDEDVMVGHPKTKLAIKALAPKRKARGSAAWESNNSHPIYAADEYVWGEDTNESWTGPNLIDRGPIIRTRAGNKGRGKRGGSQWDSRINHPAIVGACVYEGWNNADDGTSFNGEPQDDRENAKIESATEPVSSGV